VIAFGEQVQVHLAQQQLLEAVRVFGDLFATGPLDLQQVRLAAAEMPDKQAWHLSRVEAADVLAAVPGQYLDTQGFRQEGANELAALLVIMGPED
jgi:hypothetical protein